MLISKIVSKNDDMKKIGLFSEKVNVSLPQGVYWRLKKIAESQNRSEANLAAFMVEYFLFFHAPGVYFPKDEFNNEEEDVISIDSGIQSILEKSILGEVLTDCEKSLLAEAFQIDQGELLLKKTKLVREKTLEKLCK